jgi:hypothetical protein
MERVSQPLAKAGEVSRDTYFIFCAKQVPPHSKLLTADS